jgi:hypothetical protein
MKVKTKGDVTMHDNPATAPASLLSRAKQEAKEIGLVTLYFLLCFSVGSSPANTLP